MHTYFLLSLIVSLYLCIIIYIFIFINIFLSVSRSIFSLYLHTLAPLYLTSTHIILLGKTVTALALILSTCGILPKQPLVPENDLSLRESWKLLRAQQEDILRPIFFKLLGHLGKLAIGKRSAKIKNIIVFKLNKRSSHSLYLSLSLSLISSFSSSYISICLLFSILLLIEVVFKDGKKCPSIQGG